MNSPLTLMARFRSFMDHADLERPNKLDTKLLIIVVTFTGTYIYIYIHIRCIPVHVYVVTNKLLVMSPHTPVLISLSWLMFSQSIPGVHVLSFYRYYCSHL